MAGDSDAHDQCIRVLFFAIYGLKWLLAAVCQSNNSLGIPPCFVQLYQSVCNNLLRRNSMLPLSKRILPARPAVTTSKQGVMESLTERDRATTIFWQYRYPKQSVLHCAKQLANDCLVWSDYMCFHAEISIFELGMLVHDLCQNTGLQAKLDEKARRTSCA